MDAQKPNQCRYCGMPVNGPDMFCSDMCRDDYHMVMAEMQEEILDDFPFDLLMVSEREIGD